ncbi:hypothetical protein AB0D38_19330 [Streptomyces sp. NPDC048279]|uniref:hypothetical protein n=1 Tax=Streptomyces sp. NPDC048279 TaxID=3154714 RepID=UPI0034326E32
MESLAANENLWNSTVFVLRDLRLVETVARPGLSGRGPVKFTPISRWRRRTSGDCTGALRLLDRLPAPSEPRFEASTTAANRAAQTAAATRPMPGPAQSMPRAGTRARPRELLHGLRDRRAEHAFARR